MDSLDVANQDEHKRINDAKLTIFFLNLSSVMSLCGGLSKRKPGRWLTPMKCGINLALNWLNYGEKHLKQLTGISKPA